jgi:hypothetical protein
VLGHRGIEGDEAADQLERLGSECPFIGTAPACGISARITKKVVRYWTNRQQKILESLTRLEQAKSFLEPSDRRSKNC